jgi:hypothetical protein
MRHRAKVFYRSSALALSDKLARLPLLRFCHAPEGAGEPSEVLQPRVAVSPICPLLLLIIIIVVILVDIQKKAARERPWGCARAWNGS